MEDPVEIPWDALSPETLDRVIESFVLREGTDYGERECPLDQKIAQVLAQLKRGEARILFESESATITIVAARAPAGARAAPK